MPNARNCKVSLSHSSCQHDMSWSHKEKPLPLPIGCSLGYATLAISPKRAKVSVKSFIGSKTGRLVLKVCCVSKPHPSCWKPYLQ
ncbi:Uncharacterised protein [Vibrio cholerae]|nr:Uncharacterised protein [Vibrio cholerae]